VADDEQGGHVDVVGDHLGKARELNRLRWALDVARNEHWGGGGPVRLEDGERLLEGGRALVGAGVVEHHHEVGASRGLEPCGNGFPRGEQVGEGDDGVVVAEGCTRARRGRQRRAHSGSDRKGYACGPPLECERGERVDARIARGEECDPAALVDSRDGGVYPLLLRPDGQGEALAGRREERRCLLDVGAVAHDEVRRCEQPLCARRHEVGSTRAESDEGKVPEGGIAASDCHRDRAEDALREHQPGVGSGDRERGGFGNGGRADRGIDDGRGRRNADGGELVRCEADDRPGGSEDSWVQSATLDRGERGNGLLGEPGALERGSDGAGELARTRASLEPHPDDERAGHEPRAWGTPVLGDGEDDGFSRAGAGKGGDAGGEAQSVPRCEHQRCAGVEAALQPSGDLVGEGRRAGVEDGRVGRFCAGGDHRDRPGGVCDPLGERVRAAVGLKERDGEAAAAIERHHRGGCALGPERVAGEHAHHDRHGCDRHHLAVARQSPCKVLGRGGPERGAAERARERGRVLRERDDDAGCVDALVVAGWGLDGRAAYRPTVPGGGRGGALRCSAMVQPRTWIDADLDTGFGLDHLPLGVGQGGVLVRIGDRALELARLAEDGVALGVEPEVLRAADLTPLLASGPDALGRLREAVVELATGPARDDVARALVSVDDVQLRVPVRPRTYVDFYASLDHATNAGRLFRPDGDPLPAAWRLLPIAYHGRSSTVVVSGTPVRRPWGQWRGEGGVRLAPSARLDFEAEVGFVLARASTHGEPLRATAFRAMVGGVVLANDWSARDIQALETFPLGPFASKAFATSIAGWLTPLAALEAARVASPRQDPPPAAHLVDEDPWCLDLELEVLLNGETIARPPARTTYWTPGQMLAQLTSSGAPVEVGDLYCSGTVSGPSPEEVGSLLERTWGGTRPLRLADGTERAWLADGDIVEIRASAPGAFGGRIRLGSVVGRIEPALPHPW